MYITYSMRGGIIMTNKQKLQFFVDNGMSLSYISKQMNVNITTLSKWLHNQKGISTKNEEKLLLILQDIVDKFQQTLEG